MSCIRFKIKNMTEKGFTNKEARHQSAKNKYQHYQRVLSCKNLLKNVSPLTPSPGQFIVENNKPTQLPKLSQSKSYSILLTKNIRNIVQKHNPTPLNEMLSQVVAKKNINSSTAKPKTGFKKQHSRQSFNHNNQPEPYFKRPISAKIYQETEGREIQQSRILRVAIEEDKKTRKKQQTLRKNYFQVKPKLKIPKHIHGYNMVSLEQKSSNKYIESQRIPIELQNHLKELNQKYEKNFLPTQYYLNQTMKPEELIQKYKNQDGIIFGFSKWFHNDGSFSWKRCRIIGYLHNQERWEIEWLGSGIIKKVSRNNLYFENQNFEQFEKSVLLAQQLRRKSEVFMKYNILINLLNSPTPEISQQTQKRIINLINVSIPKNKNRNQIIELRQKLIEDVKKLYERACHKFQFNLMLPYNEGYKKMFYNVLPEQMFDSNPRKMMVNDSVQQMQKLSNPECAQLFSNGLKKIKQKCFLNSEKKIKILQLVNIISQELSTVDLLKDYKKFQAKAYTIKEVGTLINRNINEYLYKINCRICDIEHHVSKQLDPMYANKKFIADEVYNSNMSKYHKFLLLVNMKLESFIRESVTNVIRKLINSLPTIYKEQSQNQNEDSINWKILFTEQKIALKIDLQANIKEGKLQMIPNGQQLTEIVIKNVERIMAQLKNLKCVSKTYLPQVRPENLLRVINPNFETEEIKIMNQTVSELKQKLDIIQKNLFAYFKSLNSYIQEIFILNVQLPKKFQKKNSYGQIEQIIDKINIGQKQMNKLIKINELNLCGIFAVNFEQVRSKYNAKISQTMKQLSSMLIEKIYKDNQKIDKSVDAILEAMYKIPGTIAEFVELQTYVTQTAKQQIQKTHLKAKILTQKMNLLEKTSQIIQYRQFQSCCQIYLKPLKLKKARDDVLYKLENIYKKNFAEELMKDSYTVLDNIRNCQKMFSQSLNHRSLEQMDKNFNVFSQLNSQIQSSCQKMSTINEKQVLLKWSKTNFDRLLQVKQQFEPYYKLITLHKNFRLNLVPLMDEAFVQINCQHVSNNVLSSVQTLKTLFNNKFTGDSTYEPIVQSILKQYQEFNSNLPLIKTLRNPDLRQRHWIIIEKITGIANIRGDSITLRQILSQPIKSQEAQLIKVSQIATKQLIYQKSLNQLKRQWKDVRIVLKQLKIGNQPLKFFKNAAQIQKKLQNDILEVNNILSSSFIKFLQADVSQWKSSVLEKVYEFINYWPGFESKIIFYLRLLNSPKMLQVFPAWSTLLKNFQKYWKQFITNIEFQSLIVDVVNTRTWQSMSSLQTQIKEIQKMLSSFLEDKKKLNSKLRLFSDDALITMMVQSNSQSTFENIKKCFAGAKSFKIIQQQDSGCQNIQIVSTLDEKILVALSQNTNNKNTKQAYQFDQLLFSIDKQLKKKIKSTFLSSLSEQGYDQQKLLCQVQLLKQRLIFSNTIQKRLQTNQTLDSFQLELTSDQRQLVQRVRKTKDPITWKKQSLLVLQYINQINIIKQLNQTQNPLQSFTWFKTPKYQLPDQALHKISTNSKLKFIIGNYSSQYLFQLIQCQNFITNPLCDSLFLHICTALNDKMMIMLQGSHNSSRIISLNYLGQLMGRNVTIVSCSCLTTSQNILQYLKIAASGLFLILQQLNKLKQQSLSVFNQSLSIFLINYQLSRNNITSFYINNQQVLLDTNNFSLFGICNNIRPLQNKTITLKQAFRTFNLIPIQSKYLLKCALLSVGMINVDKIDIGYILAIVEELAYQKRCGVLLDINCNTFIWQIVDRYSMLMKIKQAESDKDKIGEGGVQKQQADKQQMDDNININGYNNNKNNTTALDTKLLYQSVQQILQLYLPYSQNHDSNIWQSLYKLKLLHKKRNLPFTKIQININSKEEQNKQDQKISEEKIYNIINQDYIVSEEYKKNMEIFKDIIDFHCGAIVVGPKMSGKSTLVKNLLAEESTNKRYNLASINPLSYTMNELYHGQAEEKPIIRQMIDQIKIKSSALQLNHQVINGLYFDCGIGEWAQPLLSIVNKPELPRISCFDGSLVNLPTKIKILFETEKIQNMSPNSFHSLGIVSLNCQIKWKRFFGNLMRKYFKVDFGKTVNGSFIRQLFQETLDSVLEFYQSILKQKSLKTESKSQILFLSRPAILQILMRFFSVIYNKQDIQLIGSGNLTEPQAIKQQQQKIKSQIFNVYAYSLVATLGLLIPQQSRKTFSRHFKYVLEQTNLCRYGWKKSNVLTREDENIYEFYYQNGEWKKMKNEKTCHFNDEVLFMDQYQILQKNLMHHAEYGIPCFLVGEECSSKNFIFKSFMSDLKGEKFTKNYFTFSSLTKKFGISNKIQEMLQTQKYSRKLNGFSNCKKNIIYVQDLNMVTLSPGVQKNGSVLQFIREFYREKSLYIKNALFGFSNLQFYGTLNLNQPMPNKILRFINPILMNNPENRVPSILEYNLKSSPMSTFEKQLIIRCTQNLHDVIKRQLSQTQVSKNLFNLRDMIKVTQGVCRITQNSTNTKSLTMNTLLKYWVYLVDRIYGQKIPMQKKNVLFYLINNVLMEQERIRYRTIYPKSDFYIVGLPEPQTIQTSKNIKYSKPNYETYTISTLRERLNQISNKFKDQNKYLAMFIDENSNDIVKLLARFLNCFQFESKVVILFNEQRRKIHSILKIVSIIYDSMFFDSQGYSLSKQIKPQDELRKQRSLNYSFTKEYIDKFGHPTAQPSKVCSPFQTPFQTKTKIQGGLQSKTSSNIPNATSLNIKQHPKNKIILHFNDNQIISQSTMQGPNFILQDILSYIKLKKHPSWAIPKQDLYESIEESQISIYSKKNTIMSKYLINRDSQQLSKQLAQKQQLCRNMDMNIILQYHGPSQYLSKYYMNLVDQCSLVFLNNPVPDCAQVDKTNKVIVTDVKYDDQFDQDYQENTDLRLCSAQEIKRNANKYGRKVYMDYIYDVFVQYLSEIEINSSSNKPLGYKQSFRNIFSKFLNTKKQRNLKKSNVQAHVKKTLDTVAQIKHKLEYNKKEQLFLSDQNKSKLQQIKSKISKQQDKYISEKKKIEDIKEKIIKKQKEYEQNIQFYRKSMDKLSFQYGKIKQKLMKVIVSFENGKFNLANAMSMENKLMLESLCCLLYIVDLKKNEDVSMIAMREFNKLIKQKKVSKILTKTNIQSLPQKAIAKAQKTLQQLECFKSKISEAVSTKKIQQVVDGDENTMFRTSMMQFLQICLIASKQFNSQKIKQAFDNFQNASKMVDKLKSDQAKKQKSKAIKQLFTEYQTLTKQRNQCQQRNNTHTKNITQINNVLKNLQKFTNTHIPQILQISNKQAQFGQQKQSSALIMSICVRYFNQLFLYTREQLTKIFTCLHKRWSQQQLGIQQWYSDIKISQNMLTNSIFNYKGYILLQTKANKYSSQQNRSVIVDLLYNDRTLKYMSIKQLQNINSQQLLNYDGVIVQISIEQYNERESICAVQGLLGMGKSQQYWNKPIFIECAYFTDEQMCNYPYINFVTNTKTNTNNNNTNINSIALPYSYIYTKCKQSLYPDSNNNSIKYTNKQQPLSHPIQNTTQQNIDNNSLLSNFMKIKLQDQPIINMQQLQDSIKKIDKLFNGAQNEITNTRSVKVINDSQDGDGHEQKIENTITDKQKQRLFIEQKNVEFFSKYFMVLQAFNSITCVDDRDTQLNTNINNNSVSRSHKLHTKLSIQIYIDIIQKILKYSSSPSTIPSSSSSAQQPGNSTSLSVSSSLPQISDATVIKYLSKLKKQLPYHAPKVQYYVLLSLCNAKISTFGSENSYYRYVCLLAQQMHNMSMNMSNTSSSPPISQQPSPSPQIQQNKIQTLKQSAIKLCKIVPGLQPTIQQLSCDADLWYDDLQSIYKQQSQPNIQYHYAMLSTTPDKYHILLHHLQSKLLQKYSIQSQLFQYTTVLQKLQLLYNVNNNNTQHSHKHTSCNTNSNIVPIFVQSSYGCHQVVEFVQANKLELEIIDFEKYVHVQKGGNKNGNDNSSNWSSSHAINNNNNNNNNTLSGLSANRQQQHSIHNTITTTNNNNTNLLSTSSQKSRHSSSTLYTQLDTLLQSSKALLAIVNSYKHLHQLQQFIQLLQHKNQHKRTNKQQQLCDIRIIVLCSLQCHTIIKNCIIIKQRQQHDEHILVSVYNMMYKYYQPIIKDKFRIKEYDQLPLIYRRCIYQILGICGQAAVNVVRNWECEGYYMIRRCMEYADRLIRGWKNNKNINMNMNNMNMNNMNINNNNNNNNSKQQQYDMINRWKLYIKQILLQCTSGSMDMINSIIKKAQVQAIRVIDEQGLSVNRVNVMVNQSDIRNRVYRVLVKQHLCQYIYGNGNGNGSRMGSNIGKQGIQIKNNNIRQLYTQINNHIHQHQSNTNNNTSFTSFTSFTSLISPTDTLTPSPTSTPIHHQNTQNIQLHQLIYILIKNRALEYSLPVYALNCKIQLINTQQLQEQYKYYITNIEVRDQLACKYEKKKNKYALIFSVNVNGKSMYESTSGKKGIVITLPKLKQYTVNVAEAVCQTKYFMLGYNQVSFVADVMEDR